MTARRMLIWRHGRTIWNLEGRAQGQADMPLDEVGVEQARRAAPLVAAYQPAAIVASDLSRAAATAAELAAVTGLPIAYDPDLREIDVGEWAGLTRDELLERWPREMARLEAGEDVRRPGGETVDEVAERAAKGLLRAAESVPDGATVAVATHGLAGGVGLSALLGVRHQPPVFRGMENCHWAVCEHRSTGWVVTGWNLGPES